MNFNLYSSISPFAPLMILQKLFFQKVPLFNFNKGKSLHKQEISTLLERTDSKRNEVRGYQLVSLSHSTCLFQVYMPSTFLLQSPLNDS